MINYGSEKRADCSDIRRKNFVKLRRGAINYRMQYFYAEEVH